MKNKLLTIKQAADKLGINPQTLRRWDKSNRLVSVRGENNYRYYKKQDIEEYIKNNLDDILKMARNWVLNDPGIEPLSGFYCKDSAVFQARLTRLRNELSKTESLKDKYFSITSVTGEIGDNSFGHNLGNWPDIMGIFFAYDLKKRKIVLADRGQGVLSTLKKVKPELNNHLDALKTAFTEVISGRSPESRGNGLKYVKHTVVSNEMKLFFQTGDAELQIKESDFNLNIHKASIKFRGCLALIQF